jgi:3-isopropylmalate dehydratase small subunit
MYKYIVVILLLSKIVMANDNYLEVDDTKQKIEKCDNFGWCKIRNKGYVKRFKFSISKDKRFLIKKFKGLTYFYKYNAKKDIFENIIAKNSNRLYKNNTANDNYLEVDDAKQRIEKCDNFGWCKIRNKGYVKRFKFAISKDKKFLIKKFKGLTYFYKYDARKDIFENMIAKKDTFKNMIAKSPSRLYKNNMTNDNYLKVDDTKQRIEKCDNFGWCKIYNKGYVKRFKFAISRDNKFLIKKFEGLAYFYKYNAKNDTFENIIAKNDTFKNTIAKSPSRLYKNNMVNNNYLEVDSTKQRIEICDKFGWCKIYNKNYLRKFQFVVSKDKKFLRKGVKGPVYFYKLGGDKRFHGYTIATRSNNSNKKILIKKDKPSEFISLEECDELNSNDSASLDENDESNSNYSVSLDKGDELDNNYSVSLDQDDELDNNYSASSDQDDELIDNYSASLDENDESDSNYFVTLGTGSSNYNINSKSDIDYENDSLADSAKTFDMSMGYNFDEDYFATLNLQSSVLPNMKLTYLYSTFNYAIDAKIDKLNTYLGIISGYGTSKWDKSPVLLVDNSDETKSIVYGLQLGSNYEITQKYSFLFEIKHIKDNFGTNINIGTAIEHASHTSIILGVKYEIN